MNGYQRENELIEKKPGAPMSLLQGPLINGASGRLMAPLSYGGRSRKEYHLPHAGGPAGGPSCSLLHAYR